MLFNDHVLVVLTHRHLVECLLSLLEALLDSREIFSGVVLRALALVSRELALIFKTRKQLVYLAIMVVQLMLLLLQLRVKLVNQLAVLEVLAESALLIRRVRLVMVRPAHPELLHPDALLHICHQHHVGFFLILAGLPEFFVQVGQLTQELLARVHDGLDLLIDFFLDPGLDVEREHGLRHIFKRPLKLFHRQSHGFSSFAELCSWMGSATTPDHLGRLLEHLKLLLFF